MSPTDEQLLKMADDQWTTGVWIDVKAAATELLALRAAWKIAEPHLPDQVYRRALDALKDIPK